MKKKIKKCRCPKCGEAFLDTDEATAHAKENKHWGDYNIRYDEQGNENYSYLKGRIEELKK